MSFDTGKEGMFVMSHEDPSPGVFKILGVDFDCKLSMEHAIHELVHAVRLRIAMIKRSRPY